MKTYQTSRLQLLPLSASDAHFIFALLNSEGWKKYIGDRNIHTLDDALAYIEKVTKSDSVKMWAVQSIENQKTMGMISVIQRDYLPHPDIGFAFLDEYAGQNYAFEAAHIVLQDIISEPHNLSIYATTLPENVRSIALLHRLGLQFERVLQVENEALRIYVIHQPTSQS